VAAAGEADAGKMNRILRYLRGPALDIVFGAEQFLLGWQLGRQASSACGRPATRAFRMLLGQVGEGLAAAGLADRTASMKRELTRLVFHPSGHICLTGRILFRLRRPPGHS
jgi:hypothetical protein